MQRRVAFDLPGLVLDLDVARIDIGAIGLQSRLDQPVVPADEKVAFLDDVANLDRDLEHLRGHLAGQLHGLRLFDCSAAADHLVQVLSPDRHGLDR